MSYNRVPQGDPYGRPPAGGPPSYTRSAPPPNGHGAPQGRPQMPGTRFTVVKNPDKDTPFENRAIVNRRDFQSPWALVNGTHILNLRPVGGEFYKHDPIIEAAGRQSQVPEPPRPLIGLSVDLRKFLRVGSFEEDMQNRAKSGWPLDVNDPPSVYLEPYDPERQGEYAKEVKIRLEWYRIGTGANVRIKRPSPVPSLDQDGLETHFVKLCENTVVTPNSWIPIKYQGTDVRGMVTQVTWDDGTELGFAAARGMITKTTEVIFESEEVPVEPSMKRGSKLFKQNFDFNSMGIGGLDDEFAQIFRRAFASRIFPQALVKKMGIQHVKGILLYGPPGTGKTLIARQIGKALNSKTQPKIVNGPEILNKYVGQSEENIRKLFADAEAEYKSKGDDSDLHIIIFDELDAICKQRGNKNDSTGVGDTVVNQLLSKMDGVDQLNNVLIIGMTNRKDMIDEALLRPGRLEVHIEISLPDEMGRRQILTIRTQELSANKVLDQDVNIEELASLTKNFSGAEIGGLVKSATSFAFSRHTVKQGDGIETQDLQHMKVTRGDFIQALDEVRPAFGVSEEELERCTTGGILRFSKNIDNILAEGKLYVEQVRKSERTPLVSVLMHGPPGSGKTALAATIASASEFPYIKIVSPENMVGFNEMNKINHLTKIFEDAYKSTLNIVVVDQIERIIDWVPLGPRFSNSILQTLFVLLRKPPPKGRRLLVLATTTERSILTQLNLVSSFDAEIAVPNVSDQNELKKVLDELDLFDEGEKRKVMEDLERYTGTKNVGVGIKKVLMAAETARQDEGDVVGRFVDIVGRDVMVGMSSGGY